MSRYMRSVSPQPSEVLSTFSHGKVSRTAYTQGSRYGEPTLGEYEQPRTPGRPRGKSLNARRDEMMTRLSHSFDYASGSTGLIGSRKSRRRGPSSVMSDDQTRSFEEGRSRLGSDFTLLGSNHGSDSADSWLKPFGVTRADLPDPMQPVSAGTLSSPLGPQDMPQWLQSIFADMDPTNPLSRLAQDAVDLTPTQQDQHMLFMQKIQTPVLGDDAPYSSPIFSRPGPSSSIRMIGEPYSASHEPSLPGSSYNSFAPSYSYTSAPNAYTGPSPYSPVPSLRQPDSSYWTPVKRSEQAPFIHRPIPRHITSPSYLKRMRFGLSESPDAAETDRTAEQEGPIPHYVTSPSYLKRMRFGLSESPEAAEPDRTAGPYEHYEHSVRDASSTDIAEMWEDPPANDMGILQERPSDYAWEEHNSSEPYPTPSLSTQPALRHARISSDEKTLLGENDFYSQIHYWKPGDPVLSDEHAHPPQPMPFSEPPFYEPPPSSYQPPTQDVYSSRLLRFAAAMDHEKFDSKYAAKLARSDTASNAPSGSPAMQFMPVPRTPSRDWRHHSR